MTAQPASASFFGSPTAKAWSGRVARSWQEYRGDRGVAKKATQEDFLSDNYVALGMPADPRFMPYYLLIVSEDTSADDDEMPRHEVSIRLRFFIAAHKTTQGQFEKVLHRNPSAFSAQGARRDKVAGVDTTQFPVETVTWFDAIEFCNKLSEREGRRPCYKLTAIQRENDGSITDGLVDVLKYGTGYRLPSEAEWEYCARAGTTTKYWFGDDYGQLGEYAWFESNSDGRTHPVGEKKLNPRSLYDMGGLAWEWCEDVWHDNYVGAPADGSAWRTGGGESRRVVRGGSWDSIVVSCRSAVRGRYEPFTRDSGVGFRVVLVSP
jgi:formylglycine-generating enzyme required for sulfatase activity